MIILAIETSCDDTGIALLKVKGKNNACFYILANTISSQTKLHAKYGGVYPFLAKREHEKNLPIVLKKSLQKAGLSLKKADLIAVTVGPGLEPCLWSGINFAKNLAQETNKPIVAVNHIEGHIMAGLAELKTKNKYKKAVMPGCPKIFPAVCLIASGGHTQIILIKKIGQYKLIGETRDDAAGECFDKSARLLGLGYPGGPAIARKAAENKQATESILPRPMIFQKNYDFSFSGLKTALLYKTQNNKNKMKNKAYIALLATEVEQAIVDVLLCKTIKAAKDYKAKAIILAGGVAANKSLRLAFEKKIKELPDIKYLQPNLKLCTDNAVMIGIAAYFNRQQATNWKKIKANANLRIRQQANR